MCVFQEKIPADDRGDYNKNLYLYDPDLLGFPGPQAFFVISPHFQNEPDL